MASSIPLVTGASIPLPPGYKFNPTDQDIVVRYLRCRAVNQPLPSAVIVDKDVLDHSPWDLVPETASEKYFFYRRVVRWENGTRWKRAAKEGYWKASGKEVPIFVTGVRSRVPLMVGIKRTMVFYRGKPLSGERTGWVMQEYRLAGGGLSPYRVVIPCKNSDLGQSSSTMKVSNKKHGNPADTLHATTANIENANIMLNPDSSWVVCRIHKKRRTRTPPVIITSNNSETKMIRFFDFMGQGNHHVGGASSSMPPMEKENAAVEDQASSSENASTGHGM